jgi:hypothetical protein
LSVVIPAFNAAGDLPHLLSALAPQLGADDEVIVVDDCSTDATAEAAARFPVTLLRTPGRSGPAAARNLGARAASGDLLVFLDADVTPRAGVLDRFRRHLAAPGLAAVMGSYDDAPHAPGLVSRYRNLLHCYTHRTGSRDASTFWAGCGAIRREVFERLGGFDAARYPNASIEDIELGVRLRRGGEKILLDPEIQVTHRKQWRLGGMLRTDVLRRALPWSELILEHGSAPADLNLKPAQRLSAVCVALSASIAPLLLWRPAAASLAMAILLALACAMNWPFYRFLAARGGWGFAAAAFPLHLLYFLCSLAGFALAAARRLARPLPGK